MNGAYFSRQPNGAWIRYAIICVMDVESDIELDSYQTLHNVCPNIAHIYGVCGQLGASWFNYSPTKQGLASDVVRVLPIR